MLGWLVPVALGAAPPGEVAGRARSEAPESPSKAAGEAFSLRAPSLDKPIANQAFSLYLSFRNATDATVVHELSATTTRVHVVTGDERRALAVDWSLEKVKVPAGQVFAVFGSVVLPAGTHEITVEHTPTATRRSVTVEVVERAVP